MDEFDDEHDLSTQMISEIMVPNGTNQLYLKNAGDLFNAISGSNRQIVPDFYDCGTTARAIFMSLINTYRGDISLSQEEKAHMRNYVCVNQVADAIQRLEEMGCGVMICSLVIYNLDSVSKHTQSELGHVWIIEKNDATKTRYRLYQSSLNNYKIIDHMVKYGLGIDGPRFLKKLKPLLNAKKWSEQKQSLYSKLFHYLPTIPLNRVHCVLHWTSIEY